MVSSVILGSTASTRTQTFFWFTLPRQGAHGIGGVVRDVFGEDLAIVLDDRFPAA